MVALGFLQAQTAVQSKRDFDMIVGVVVGEVGLEL